MSEIPQKVLSINFQNSSRMTLIVQSASLSAGDWGSGPADQPCIGDMIESGDGRKYKTVTNFVSGLIGQIQLITTGSGTLTLVWQWQAQGSLIFNAFVQNTSDIDVSKSVSGDNTTKTAFVTAINASPFVALVFMDQES